MTATKNTLQRLLEDYVVLDCRLRDHPKVSAAVRIVEGDNLVVVAATGKANERSLPRSVPIHSSASGYLFEKREIFSIPDHPEYASPFYDFSGRPMRSILAVPILSPEPIGVLSLTSPTPNALQDRKHLGRALILAALIAYNILQLQRGIRSQTPVSLDLGKALGRLREEAGLSQEELADRVGTSRIALSRWESGAQPPSAGLLERWCEVLELVSPGEPTIVTSVDITPHLLSFLREDPARLAQLQPEQFERLIAELLDRMGYDVKLTGETSMRDGGIDLIALPKVRSITSFLVAAQIKHHRTGAKTGRSAVDRLLAWKDSAFRIGLLVTNTGFTRDALWVAAQDSHRAFLRLRDFEDLKRWLQDNFWSEEEWREIPRQISLAPGLTVEIPRSELRNSLDIWPMTMRIEKTDKSKR